MSRIYYCICDDNCKFPTMTAEQILAAIAEATGNTPTGVDDAFITKIKEQNAGGALTFWSGTEAEFNALGVSAIPTVIRVGDDGKIYITDANMENEYVPKTRTINEKPLSENIILSNDDVKAAPAGYGYGEVMEHFYANDDSDGSKLHTWLDEVLGTMKNGMSKQIRISDYPYTSGAALYGSIFRHTNDYAMVVMFGYGHEAFYLKQKSNGTWGQWSNGIFAGAFSYSNGTLTITTT